MGIDWETVGRIVDRGVAAPGSAPRRAWTLRLSVWRPQLATIGQDAHYLRQYARALSVAAARAPVEADIAMFNEHAAGAIAIERPSQGVLRRLRTERAGRCPHADRTHEPRLHEPPPRHRLRRLVPRSARPAALLLDLLGGGQGAARQESSDPLDARWIETTVARSSPRSSEPSSPSLTASDPSADERAPSAHFAVTSCYEWMFWEMGYRRERWPI